MGARQSNRQSLAFALVSGAASTIPLWRAPRGVKIAVIGGTGLVAGAGAFVALHRPDLLGADRPAATAPQAVAAGTLAAGAGAGTAALGFVADRAFEQFLVRHDVAHPRVVLGVVGGVLSYVLDVLDRRFDTDD